MVLDFTPPFQPCDYVDIKLRVYLSKDSGEHLSKPFNVATGVAHTMNSCYKQLQRKKWWQSSPLWFAPILEIEEVNKNEQ